jgi:hypothetical protein
MLSEEVGYATKLQLTTLQLAALGAKRNDFILPLRTRRKSVTGY